jgi:hypothetical protein
LKSFLKHEEFNKNSHMPIWVETWWFLIVEGYSWLLQFLEII